MTTEERNLLGELGKSAYGKALRTFIVEGLEEIGDVERCTSWEETIGRKLSKEFLRTMFSFVLEKDTKPPSRQQYS